HHFFCCDAVLSLPPFPTRRSSDLQIPRGPRAQFASGPPGTVALPCRKSRECPKTVAIYLVFKELAARERWPEFGQDRSARGPAADRKSTRLNSSHVKSSYAVFCLK